MPEHSRGPVPDRRSARREAIRSYHPDVGGSADALNRALERVDRDFASPIGVGVRRTLRGTMRQIAKPARTQYTRLRARFPGAKTYTEI
ncbi:hypothetical protein [Rhodococcus qingshengii]|uniref:hypothetical protein n=1 Tax=Rhodococcus qingshengii TaxID=334542 RepID=UPI0019284527|nr:hypothetical protein [Rhodococcus qingshengii]